MEEIMVQNNRVLITVGMLVLLGLALSQAIEIALAQYNEQSISEIMVVYGIARALNAAISMLQGTNLNLAVLSLSVGEVLNPLNDLIERFSWVVLTAAASIGLQKVLLSILVSKSAGALIAVGVGFYLATLWMRQASQYRTIAFKFVTILLFVRFSLTLVVLANYGIDNFYLTEQKEQATQQIMVTQQSVQSASEFAIDENNLNGESASLFDKMKNTYDSAKAGLTNTTDQVSELSLSIESSISSIMDLIVLFVLQSIILPLLFLFGLYKGLSWLLGREFNVH
jgi:uncharacterized protein YxeA